MDVKYYCAELSEYDSLLKWFNCEGIYPPTNRQLNKRKHM